MKFYTPGKTAVLTNFHVSRQGIEIIMFIFNTEKNYGFYLSPLYWLE